MGNPRVLAKDALWNALLVHFKENGCLVEGPLTNLRQSAIQLPQPKKVSILHAEASYSKAPVTSAGAVWLRAGRQCKTDACHRHAIHFNLQPLPQRKEQDHLKSSARKLLHCRLLTVGYLRLVVRSPTGLCQSRWRTPSRPVFTSSSSRARLRSRPGHPCRLRPRSRRVLAPLPVSSDWTFLTSSPLN